MSGNDGSGPLDDVESGLDALVLVDLAREVLDAVDTEALQGDAPLDEAIDEGQLRQAIGGPAGRLVARQLADRATGGGVAGLVGREIAGRVGSAAVRRAMERADPEALAAAFEGVDGLGLGPGPGPEVDPGGDPVEIDVEDGSDDEA